jgi:integrase
MVFITKIIILRPLGICELQGCLPTSAFAVSIPEFLIWQWHSTTKIQAVNALIKSWSRAINLNHGNYGAHTLRKTFGVIQRTKYGVGFEVLAKRFNHSSPTTTMRCLGLTSDAVSEALMNEI